MSEPRRRGRTLVLVTIFTALCLGILPMPAWAVAFRPQWLALVLIYWVLTRPRHIGVFWAFGSGLAFDVVTGAVIGTHALSLSVVAYLTTVLQTRISPFPAWQQAGPVGLVLLVERLLSLWITTAVGAGLPTLDYWLPPVIGLLLWPWLHALLSRLDPGDADD